MKEIIKNNKKKLIIMGVVLVALVIALAVIMIFENKNKNNDAYKFKEEYPEVSEENVFVYRDLDEIIKILENGTGIVYLGFPECKWCQAYVVMLDEVAREEGLEKIYYFNILEDRKNNTEQYQKVVKLLGDNLLFDEEGNHRVYVPDVTAVLKGEIIGHDNESSVVDGKETPEQYWTEEKATKLKQRLKTMIDQINTELCTSCDK